MFGAWYFLDWLNTLSQLQIDIHIKASVWLKVWNQFIPHILVITFNITFIVADEHSNICVWQMFDGSSPVLYNPPPPLQKLTFEFSRRFGDTFEFSLGHCRADLSIWDLSWTLLSIWGWPTPQLLLNFAFLHFQPQPLVCNQTQSIYSWAFLSLQDMFKTLWDVWTEIYWS